MILSHSPVSETFRERIEAALAGAYGIQVEALDRLHAGTATDNLQVRATDGQEWFVKLHATHSELDAAGEAIALAEFVRGGGVPVPMLRRTLEGDPLAQDSAGGLSVWEFLGDARTAESGIHGAATAIGTAIGRMHELLSRHPAARPRLRPARDVIDLPAALDRCDQLLGTYRNERLEDPDQLWALEALARRREVLPEIAEALAGLPALTTQVVHGDLAAPNVLLRGDEFAAVIDFQPPSSGYVSWEVARIAYDPRTVVSDPSWQEAAGELLEAYRHANPLMRADDLHSALVVGAAYVLASTYPLVTILSEPEQADDTLRSYGRARHDAALAMLERVRA
ncbi:MAG TPA: phosphotransferase [Candidatus Brachybacterium merdavium]|uniref:Phosphotransferase n=1 Tax=Candidatus Brachybacterium merdavium TaxID=2838513 RepID=A0A9D2LB10_9MICO|nr:phosphotransferase [Candidatus Brachybacterium merdavium]